MPNESIEYNGTSALILAAGNSSRMGSPKFMLKFDETHTFLEKIIESYQNFGCKDIVVVLNPSGYGILKQSVSKIVDYERIVVNYHPEKERFLSIKKGLNALIQPTHVFIHPVDNPFVNFRVLNQLVNNCIHGDYQIPTSQSKGGHPILISPKVLENICCFSEEKIHFKVFLSRFVRHCVEVNTTEILFNINERVDYIKFVDYFNLFNLLRRDSS